MSDLVRADEVRPAVDAFEQRFMVADHGVPYRQRRRPFLEVWAKFRGSFIRHRFLSRQTLYSMPGDAGHGVSIRWEDERGRERTAIVASQDAEALVRQIQGRLQRRALPSGSPAALAERSDS